MFLFISKSHVWSSNQIWELIVYAHGHRLCSNRFWHGSTTISYPQCSLTFLHERYLHRCRVQPFAIRTYAMSTVGIDVMNSHTKYCRIAYGITRQQNALQGTNEWMASEIVFQPRNGMKPTPLIFAWNQPMKILVSAFEIWSGLFNKHQL